MNVFGALITQALSGVSVPPGTQLNDVVATDRYTYGYQVFLDGESEVLICADGYTRPASAARDMRVEAFAAMVDAIYGPKELVPANAPIEDEPETFGAGDFVDDPSGPSVCTLDPEFNIPVQVIPFPDEDFVSWEGGMDYPPELDPDDRIVILMRNGMTATGRASDFRWNHSFPDSPVNFPSSDVIAYKKQNFGSPKSTNTPPVAEPDTPQGFQRWDSSEEDYSRRGPIGLDSRAVVWVKTRDNRVIRSKVQDVHWAEDESDDGVVAWRVAVESTGLVVAEPPKPAVDDSPDEIFFGSISEDDAKESGYVPVTNMLSDEMEMENVVTAFRFRDGHVVVAKDGCVFWEKMFRSLSTFRQPKDSELVASYRKYPSTAVFAKVKHADSAVRPYGKAPNVDIFSKLRIYFAVGMPGGVKKDGFEIDWSLWGDPRNDVVAYEVVKA